MDPIPPLPFAGARIQRDSITNKTLMNSEPLWCVQVAMRTRTGNGSLPSANRRMPQDNSARSRNIDRRHEVVTQMFDEESQRDDQRNVAAESQQQHREAAVQLARGVGRREECFCQPWRWSDNDGCCCQQADVATFPDCATFADFMLSLPQATLLFHTVVPVFDTGARNGRLKWCPKLRGLFARNGAPIDGELGGYDSRISSQKTKNIEQKSFFRRC